MSGQVSGSSFVPVDAVYADDGVGYVSMTAGERLREARAKMSLSLKQAADATRIRADYLEALEAMDSRGLPARAYAIGYLRTYASSCPSNRMAWSNSSSARSIPRPVAPSRPPRPRAGTRSSCRGACSVWPSS